MQFILWQMRVFMLLFDFAFWAVTIMNRQFCLIDEATGFISGSYILSHSKNGQCINDESKIIMYEFMDSKFNLF